MATITLPCCRALLIGGKLYPWRLRIQAQATEYTCALSLGPGSQFHILKYEVPKKDQGCFRETPREVSFEINTSSSENTRQSGQPCCHNCKQRRCLCCDTYTTKQCPCEYSRWHPEVQGQDPSVPCRPYWPPQPLPLGQVQAAFLPHGASAHPNNRPSRGHQKSPVIAALNPQSSSSWVAC